MTKRVTIMIDDNHDRKIRSRQADLIKKTNGSYSYSQVINDLLGKVL